MSELGALLGPLGVLYSLVTTIAAVAVKLKANRAAAEALAKRSDLVVVTLDGQVKDSQDGAVLANIEALESILSAISRLLEKLAAQNTLQQALAASTNAGRIKSFDAQLTQFIQSLQLSVSFQHDAVAKATLQDMDELPSLMEQLLSTVDTKFNVQQQQLETLTAIIKHQAELIESLPQRMKPKVDQLLGNTAQVIVAKSGRGLSSQRDWTIDADDIDIMWNRSLGSGSFGHIYRGIWDGKEVAVKVMDGARGREAVESIEKEAAVWYPLNHTNVLRLWRVCLNTDRPFIVMPVMICDLGAFITKFPDTDMRVRTSFLLGIARGMQYLHTLPEPIIHGDLKTSNVLVGESGEVQLTDFGMAFVKTTSSATTKRRSGAVRWIPPEKYKRGYVLSLPLDVFSFGMTAYHVVTGKLPFHDIESDEDAKELIKSGERPARPDGVPDALWRIICDCWHTDPDARPTFRNIAARLNALPRSKLTLPSNAMTQSVEAEAPAEKPELKPLDEDARRIVTPVGKLRNVISAVRLRPGSVREDDGPQPVAKPHAEKIHRAYTAPSSEALHVELPKSSALNEADETAVLAALPSWCRRVGIKRETFAQFNKTIESWDSKRGKSVQKPMIEWSEQGNVVGLRLMDQGITGPLSRVLFALKNLRILNLSSNKFEGPVSDDLGGLVNLTHLDLSQNRLTTLPESLGDLKNLIELNLSNNRFVELPASIGRLAKLEKLSAHDNEITALPDSIGELHTLQHLGLDSNRIEALPETIGMLRELRDLWLECNRISHIPGSIGQLEQLTELHLWDNQISWLPGTLGNLKQLTGLWLENNNLSELPRTLGTLPKLKEFTLDGNALPTEKLMAQLI
nr:hypothetical protein HK105_004681 [Polyrhizophydium stewartii]